MSDNWNDSVNGPSGILGGARPSGSLGAGPCRTEAYQQCAQGVPGGPRPEDQYATQKQEYYSSPLINELQNRRRTLEARKNQIAIDLDVIYALLRTLVD